MTGGLQDRVVRNEEPALVWALVTETGMFLPSFGDTRGWPLLHRMHVLQAPEGCDYDYLRPRTPEELAFVEPVVGRS